MVKLWREKSGKIYRIYIGVGFVPDHEYVGDIPGNIVSQGSDLIEAFFTKDEILKIISEKQKEFPQYTKKLEKLKKIISDKDVTHVKLGDAL